MVPRKVDGVSDYSNDVKQWMQMKDPETQKELIHVQYQSTYELTVLNHKGEITVEKKFRDPGGHDANPVSGTYNVCSIPPIRFAARILSCRLQSRAWRKDIRRRRCPTRHIP